MSRGVRCSGYPGAGLHGAEDTDGLAEVGVRGQCVGIGLRSGRNTQGGVTG